MAEAAAAAAFTGPAAPGARLAAAAGFADQVRRLIETVVSVDSTVAQLDAAREHVAAAIGCLEQGAWRHHDVAPSLDREVGSGLRAHGVVTGVAHPSAPPLHLEWSGERVVGRCRLGRIHEGPRGFVHGGVSAMLMDEICAKVPTLRDSSRVTRSLTVRYRRPVPLFRDLVLEAAVTAVDGREAVVHGSLATADAPDVPLVVGDGVFVVFEPGSTAHAIGDTRG